jgi:hypothetical protein
MSGYAPERPRKILKPIGNWVKFSNVTAEQIWATPQSRTGLWAVVSMIFYGALLGLHGAGLFPPPLLFASAVLLPPLFFTGIVPPHGHAFADSYLKGLFFTGGLLLFIALIRAIGGGGRFRRMYDVALSWG